MQSFDKTVQEIVGESSPAVTSADTTSLATTTSSSGVNGHSSNIPARLFMRIAQDRKRLLKEELSAGCSQYLAKNIETLSIKTGVPHDTFYMSPHYGI